MPHAPGAVVLNSGSTISRTLHLKGGSNMFRRFIILLLLSLQLGSSSRQPPVSFRYAGEAFFLRGGLQQSLEAFPLKPKLKLFNVS
jgi:hypothetical protein